MVTSNGILFYGTTPLGAIDWEEFTRVIKGQGQCNADRLNARQKAHDEGAWVREAASAYAKKRAARQQAQKVAAE